MRWDEIGEMRCSVARTLSVVGDRWTLLILRDCFLGQKRFDGFLDSLRISPHLLSTRLAKLVEHGVLEKRPYGERDDRHEYRLTEKGLDLHAVIGGLVRWGDRWMDDGIGPPVAWVHTACGHVTTPELHCSECGEPLEPREIRTEFNPRLAEAGTAEPDPPNAPRRRSP